MFTVLSLVHTKTETTMETTREYITPSKQSPIFTATCDWFGRIELSLYKSWEITHNGTTYCGSTFELDFTRAIVRLHEWLRSPDNTVLNDYPKCNFYIEMVDGSVSERYGQEIVYTKVYSISAKKAKKLLF